MLRRGTLQGFAIAAFAIGLACLPWPITNPKAFSGLFGPLAAAGFTWKIGVVPMAIGALLFGSSFLIRRD